MITEITKIDDQYVFFAGKCKYKCPDFKSLVQVRAEILRQKKQR